MSEQDKQEEGDFSGIYLRLSEEEFLRFREEWQALFRAPWGPLPRVLST